ncbi:MAG: cation diffusion facilitator family transporter [Eubacteriales bacterium]|nr:cation diffusion facilitator family transporter [Eubacteriales bacterium]
MSFHHSQNDDAAIAMNTSILSILINLALSVFKLLAGFIASSNAMISDAIHSASDVFSTIIVMIGIRISNKKPDPNHPYGHERFESVAAIVLADILFVTGAMIGLKGIRTLISGNWTDAPLPGMLALWAAIISILTKEAMFWYTKIQAKKINSSALMADAWHHRSDSLSSIGSLLGIFFARKGFPFMDSVASIVICIFIIKAAWDIFFDSIDKMVDKSCPPEIVEEMRDLISKQDGVIELDSILTRSFGNRAYVDVEITADGSLSLYEAHKIAETVHKKIEHQFPVVKHITVHVNPD